MSCEGFSPPSPAYAGAGSSPVEGEGTYGLWRMYVLCVLISMIRTDVRVVKGCEWVSFSVSQSVSVLRQAHPHPPLSRGQALTFPRQGGRDLRKFLDRMSYLNMCKQYRGRGRSGDGQVKGLLSKEQPPRFKFVRLSQMPEPVTASRSGRWRLSRRFRSSRFRWCSGRRRSCRSSASLRHPRSRCPRRA